MPCLDGDIVAIDWHSFADNEFANDFAKPQGLRHSLGIFRSATTEHEGTVFTLHRTALDQQFRESE